MSAAGAYAHSVTTLADMAFLSGVFAGPPAVLATGLLLVTTQRSRRVSRTAFAMTGVWAISFGPWMHEFSHKEHA